MVLDERPEDLASEIGHDGSEIWWPGQEHPYDTRGIHIQEIIDLCIARNLMVTPIEYMPTLAPNLCTPPKPIYNKEQARERFRTRINNNDGLLIGPNHAAAWNGWQVYNPLGMQTDLDTFIKAHGIVSAWLIA